MIGVWASLPVPGLILAADDTVYQINPAAEEFLMSSARAVVGAPLDQVLRIEAPMEAAVKRLRRDGTPVFVNDVEVAVGEGPTTQCTLCNLQLAPMAGATGQIIMLIAPRELAGRMTQKQAVKSAARSAIGMGEMLAHEIKNPLAGIIGAAQLLAMNLGVEDREMTDLIVSESRRIVALLDQVEQFGNTRPPECSAVNLHDVLERAKRSAMVGFAARMRVSDEYDPSLPLAWADPDQLLQVLQNLLKNAAEAAGPEGGEIVLRSYYEQSLRRPGGAGGKAKSVPLQIEIVDDGPGLPPDIANDIFDPFVSGRENGTGLGLALTAKIIEEHQGLIAVSSRPGKTVFRVSLPLAPKGMKGGI
jgi:two-component system nitrogen regulation sensor histidine kinase GlnL